MRHGPSFTPERQDALDKEVSPVTSSGRPLAHTPNWDSVQEVPPQERRPEKLRK